MSSLIRLSRPNEIFSLLCLNWPTELVSIFSSVDSCVNINQIINILGVGVSVCNGTMVILQCTCTVVQF